MSRFAWGAAGILGLGLTGAVVKNRQLTAQVETLSAQLAAAKAQEAPAVATLGPHGEVYRPQPAAAAQPAAARQPDVSSSNPVLQIESAIEEEVEARLEDAVEARMAQHREERQERMRSHVTAAVDDFADDLDLTDEDREAMHGVMEGAMEELSAIWSSYRDREDREAAREEMHEEMAEVRLAMSEELTALLGEEDAEIFQESLRGPLSSRPR